VDQPGYLLTGREWDPEIGLYYYRGRYYDPKIARFSSEDPIGFAGGINFYAYVSGSPTSLNDPTGIAVLQAGPPPTAPAGSTNIPPWWGYYFAVDVWLARQDPVAMSLSLPGPSAIIVRELTLLPAI
jgi:RHS repeat-associated protein